MNNMEKNDYDNIDNDSSEVVYDNWKFVYDNIVQKYQKNKKFTQREIARVVGMTYTTLNSWTKKRSRRISSYLDFYMLMYLWAGEEYWGNIKSFLEEKVLKRFLTDTTNEKFYEELQSDFEKNKDVYCVRKQEMYQRLKESEMFDDNIIKEMFPNIFEENTNTGNTKTESLQAADEGGCVLEKNAESEGKSDVECQNVSVEKIENQNNFKPIMNAITQRAIAEKIPTGKFTDIQQKEIAYRKKALDSICGVQEKKKWLLKNTAEYIKAKLNLDNTYHERVINSNKMILESDNNNNLSPIIIMWCDENNWEQQKGILQKQQKDFHQKLFVLVIDSWVKDDVLFISKIQCVYPVLVTDLTKYCAVYNDGADYIKKDEVESIVKSEFVYMLMGSVLPWY